jgi:type I restriction enzyme, S subunit
MACDQPTTTVGEVASSISETHPFDKDHLIFLNTSDILYGNLLHRNYSAVKDWPGQAKKSIRKDDILFSEIRPANGRWAYVEDSAEDFVVSTKLMVIRANQDRAFPKFLYQFLTSRDVTRWLQHLAESRSGTFPQITFDQVAALEFPRLSVPEQKAIAAVIGALDDKIELNRRMNATLEAMARALFQSWFVDFDPVRAKLDGRQTPGVDPATAALFPSEFEDSELGRIPKGWKIRPLGELADLNWGDTTTTKASYVPRGFTAFSASGADGFLPRFDFEQTGVVVSAIGANAGATWFARGKWSCIKNTLRFWATAPGVSTEFLFFATYGREKWPQRGSAQPFISQGDARAMRVLIPKGNLAEGFGAIVRPWLAKIEANEQQSRVLATLRDTLLPKLLTGEIRALT